MRPGKEYPCRAVCYLILLVQRLKPKTDASNAKIKGKGNLKTEPPAGSPEDSALWLQALFLLPVVVVYVFVQVGGGGDGLLTQHLADGNQFVAVLQQAGNQLLNAL